MDNQNKQQPGAMAESGTKGTAKATQVEQQTSEEQPRKQELDRLNSTENEI